MNIHILSCIEHSKLWQKSDGCARRGETNAIGSFYGWLWLTLASTLCMVHCNAFRSCSCSCSCRYCANRSRSSRLGCCFLATHVPFVFGGCSIPDNEKDPQIWIKHHTVHLKPICDGRFCSSLSSFNVCGWVAGEGHSWSHSHSYSHNGCDVQVCVVICCDHGES